VDGEEDSCSMFANDFPCFLEFSRGRLAHGCPCLGRPILFGMLVKILCDDAIAARRHLPREGNVAFEDLVASDFDVGTVTFEGLTSARYLLAIMVGIATVIATMRSSGLSWSHDTCCYRWRSWIVIQ
jgi:hypothetical protein